MKRDQSTLHSRRTCSLCRRRRCCLFPRSQALYAARRSGSTWGALLDAMRQSAWRLPLHNASFSDKAFAYMSENRSNTIQCFKIFKIILVCREKSTHNLSHGVNIYDFSFSSSMVFLYGSKDLIDRTKCQQNYHPKYLNSWSTRTSVFHVSQERCRLICNTSSNDSAQAGSPICTCRRRLKADTRRPCALERSNCEERVQAGSGWQDIDSKHIQPRSRAQIS